jgi:cytochrome c
MTCWMLTRVLTAMVCGLIASTASAGKTAAVVGDPTAGEGVYARCLGCHALAYNRTGPMHCGLFGRRAGSVAGFSYSRAMQHSNLLWNRKTLDRFLANPLKVVPGTAMGYAGIADKKERTDLIAYLEQAGKGQECRK